MNQVAKYLKKIFNFEFQVMNECMPKDHTYENYEVSKTFNYLEKLVFNF